MTILKTENLTKKYGNHIVVDSLNFSLPENKCIALIGPNGAGKTTTLRILTGLIKPTTGSIQFAKHQGDYRELIGYLPQQPVFYEWMTGEEYVLFAAKLSSLSKQTALKRTNDILERLGLAEAKQKRISTYSGGMKQRLGIAQAIIHHPKLLILDEPVSALDPAGRREILNLMEILKSEMSILFSTHILADADEVCDEVILLKHGKMVESGLIESVRQKYKTEKIELAFLDPSIQYEEKLSKLNHVHSVQVVRNIYHLGVDNIQDARREILQMVTENNWELGSFHINQASLEDIFMKAVRN